MASYCSSSNDRLLTKHLIESSNSSSKCFPRFISKPSWFDGLDIWSSSQLLSEHDIFGRNIDFDEDIGLYLPRHEKEHCERMSTKSDFNCSKLSRNNLFPKRVEELIKKEKDLFEENDLNICSSDEQISLSEENQSSKTIQQLNSNEITSNKVRLPLRRVPTENLLRNNKSKEICEETYKSISAEKFKLLLKEQLTSLFTRETTNINSKRSVIRIPSVEIKHQNLPRKSFPSTDPTLIMERYAKLQQLLISSSSTSQPTINSKGMEHRQSPYIFQGTSNLGLTVTPLDFSSSKSFRNTSPERISQQNTPITNNRPLIQPVSLSSSIQQNDDQQEIIFKSQFETGFISSSADFVLSNKNSTDEQTQIIRKFHRYHRSSSKNPIQKPKTRQLLPPLIAGKRIQFPITDNQHS